MRRALRYQASRVWVVNRNESRRQRRRPTFERSATSVGRSTTAVGTTLVPDNNAHVARDQRRTRSPRIDAEAHRHASERRTRSQRRVDRTTPRPPGPSGARLSAARLLDRNRTPGSLRGVRNSAGRATIGWHRRAEPRDRQFSRACPTGLTQRVLRSGSESRMRCATSHLLACSPARGSLGEAVSTHWDSSLVHWARPPLPWRDTWAATWPTCGALE